MYQLVGVVVVVVVHVCACEVTKGHPNATSGDLIDASDYSEHIEPVSGDVPQWIRHNSFRQVAVYVDLCYGDADEIKEVSDERLLMQKKTNPGEDMNEIWYIQQEDKQLQQFFAKVFDLDPVYVTIEHCAAFKGETSLKKILVKRSILSAKDILEKLRNAVNTEEKG